MYNVHPRGKVPSPNEEDYQPHIDPNIYDGKFFQEEHGLTGWFEIDLTVAQDMEVDNDSDDDDEEEEVTDAGDLSMLEWLRLGIANDGDGDGEHEPWWHAW